MKQFLLNSAVETEALGEQLFQALPKKCLVFLVGDLGAGKTTLTRGFMKAAGYKGIVKSPTYNIVEEYKIKQRLFFHFDLYRLVDPEELEWIGMDDYLQEESVCFVEWPEKGEGYLTEPDVLISIITLDNGRKIHIKKMPETVEKYFSI